MDKIALRLGDTRKSVSSLTFQSKNVVSGLLEIERDTRSARPGAIQSCDIKPHLLAAFPAAPSSHHYQIIKSHMTYIECVCPVCRNEHGIDEHEFTGDTEEDE
jgi:hypothetical protein